MHSTRPMCPADANQHNPCPLGCRLLMFLFGAVVALANSVGLASAQIQLDQPPSLSKCPTGVQPYYCDRDSKRGISGMAPIDDLRQLVVHDGHTGEAQNARLAILGPAGIGTKMSYRPITVKRTKWGDLSKLNRKDDVSNDLESACRLWGLTGYHFLVAESGSVTMPKGGGVILPRIFHVELDLYQRDPDQYSAENLSGTDIELPKVTHEPEPTGFPPAHSQEEYEGLACLEISAQHYLVIIAERGGDSAAPNYLGTLRWGMYDVTAVPPTIVWARGTLPDIEAPGKGNHSDKEWRDITSLHIDSDGRLWASAAYDSDNDDGPFDSIVYQLGFICVDANDRHGHTTECSKDYLASIKRPRVLPLNDRVIFAVSPNRKIEAVSTAVNHGAGSHGLSIATQDENHGAVWWPNP